MKKNVLVTGASRGIGKAIAIAFAKAGYNIGINYNNSEASAKQVLSEVLSYGVDADIFPADVSNNSSDEKLADEFIKRFGRIDVLVNNAGISNISPINDISHKEWDKIISTNLSAAFYLTKAFLPSLIENKSGVIINISSIWGVSGASCEVAYSASKAGIIGFTKSLAKELGPSGIRVNSISPGVIDTEMNAELSPDTLKYLISETPLQRIGMPTDIANLAVFLASDSASFISGQNITSDGGFM